jgi:formate dehydrogenase (coenzyme F420) beta subunit
MGTPEKKMQEAAAKLLTDHTVDCVIGFQNGSRPMTSRPFFARKPQDADRMVWNKYCAANLSAYLPKLFEKPQRLNKDYKAPRIGIVVKGCDGRSVFGLVKEKQVPRENIIIIGMPCTGMVPASKNEKTGSEEIARACVECVSPAIKGVDLAIEGESRKPAKADYSRIKKFEAKPTEERWNIFVEEISRCIRCNACREACPNCYCKVCFADQRKPAWVSPANVLSETVVYHLGRMFHQAGRCVECDACVNACPMGIDLRLFTQKLASDAKELFGSVPGVTDDKVPALNTFTQDDSECFITDPEEK